MYLFFFYLEKIQLTSKYILYIMDIYSKDGGDTVAIIVSNTDGRPIYEQIREQIKAEILSGERQAGDMMPSIRTLAKDLRISVITTKRAYDELEREGFVETVPGKGTYVAQQNQEFLREELLRKAEEKLAEAVRIAKSAGLTQQELTEILHMLYEGEGI